MTNTNPPSCPKCGAPIATDAPLGLCPKCVLAEAATGTHATRATGRKSPPPALEEVAAQFPELEVVELIGSGGMGAVYKARQPKLDRFVALKILSRDLSEDPAFAERFNREARVLARLSHPNIVGVFDFGTAGPFCYLLMEFVDGVNLRQAMQAGSFNPNETLALVQDLCGALQFAHEEGILHRDIKPENVLIDTRGRVKIADFGIAKLIGENERDDYTLTMQGAVLGSPHYMAPEQIETPGEVDQRADIYSLGVVFYELLTGELPLGRFAPPSAKSSLDPRVDEIVLRTLEKERQDRFQSVEEVQTSVGAITDNPAPASSPPPPPAPAAAVAAAPVAAAQPNAITTDQGTAKGATASAICTGISLLLGIGVFATIIFLFLSVRTDASGGPGPLKIIIVLGGGVLLPLVLAVVGFVLGLRALSEIRRSGGQKAGRGRAIFGIVGWPIVLLFALIAMLLPVILRTTGAAMSWPILAGITLLVGIVVSVFLVRSLSNWASGNKSSSNGGMIALAAIVILLLLTIVPAIVGSAFLSSGNTESGSEEGPGHDWRDDPPHSVSSIEPSENLGDFTLPLIVQPGLVLTFELVETNVAGKTSSIDSMAGYLLPSDEEPWTGKFWISEVYPYDAGDGAGIRQHLQTRVGNAATVEPLQGNWELDAIEYSAFTVSNPGEHLFGIGHLLTNPSHTLSLRVVATKRSTSEFPGVTLDQAITGFGDTEDWKEAWNKYAEDKINSEKPPGLRPNP